LEVDTSDEVDQFTEPLLIEGRPRIVFREHTFERRIVAFDGDHRIVERLADGGLLGICAQVRPARFLRHPEDVCRDVFVAILKRRCSSSLSR